MTIDQAIDFRSKCKHFRILVIGRANAGKTTLLKKVCRSTKDPEIFTPNGKPVDLSLVEGSDQRGEHNIENQLVFKSNPQFVFHDSRGFESGSAEELEKVKTFVATRAKTRNLSQQLHMIWYCVPTDTDRPILEADTQFFDVCGSGSVPVIAIFTKIDGLVTKAYSELRRGGSKIADAKNQSTKIAEQKLQTDFIDPLQRTKFSPSNHVQLENAHKDETDCSALINITADAITNEGLKLLFVSVQQNNFDCSMRYAVRNALKHGRENRSLSTKIVVWFPHVWTSFDYAEDDGADVADIIDDDNDDIDAAADVVVRALVDHCDTDLHRHLPPPTHSEIESIAALCICLQHTFAEASVSQADIGPAFSRALVAYIESPLKAEVFQQITELPQDPPQRENCLCDIIKTHRLRISSNPNHV